MKSILYFMYIIIVDLEPRISTILYIQTFVCIGALIIHKVGL